MSNPASASNDPQRFVTQESFESNLKNQLAMSPETLAQLREYGITPERALKLEVFFYTDSEEKAASLARALSGLQYEVEHGPSASDERLQVITGWSVPIPMRDDAVVEWSHQMCQLGFEHDCDFDGWGTNPEQ